MMNEHPDLPEPGYAPLPLDGFDLVGVQCTTPLSQTTLYSELDGPRQITVEEISPLVTGLPDFDARFHSRFSRIESISHPHLVKLQPGGLSLHGRYYIPRERIDGHTLRGILDAGHWNPALAERVIDDLAQALSCFHRLGLAHGGLDANHIWLDANGMTKLDVCPVATFLEPREFPGFLGPEAFHRMPPEFISGNHPTPRSDIHALSALYYELLTGTPPRGIVLQLPSSVDAGSRVESLIVKGLSPDPAKRPSNLRVFHSPLRQSAPEAEMGGGEEAGRPGKRNKTTRILIAAVICLSLGWSGFYLWKEYRPSSQTQFSDAPDAATASPENSGTQGKLHEPELHLVDITGDADHVSINFRIEYATDFHLRIERLARRAEKSDANPGDQLVYFFENESGIPLSEPEALPTGREAGFSLPLALGSETPSSIRLVARYQQELLARSNLVEVSQAIANHRQSHKPPVPDSPRPVAPSGVANPIVPNTSPNTAMPRIGSSYAGDAYIYAAHFYLGADVSLLKLQFGNAGTAYLDPGSLAFQCAFSIDDRFDPLAAAAPGVYPEPQKDLAAGGFGGRWLDLEGTSLLPGKKLWTKHTFRIDTSDPELLQRAKYLLVKVNPRGSILESNYDNNVIVIPLEYANQWHTVTQDPKDREVTVEAPPQAPPP